jgi:hypothetical protein
VAEINWKYNIDDRITKDTQDGKRIIDYVITNREIRIKQVHIKNDTREFRNKNIKYYEYKCNICGAEHLSQEEVSIGENKCACCAGKIRIAGINTIGDKYPECVKYFKEGDAFDPKWSINQKYDAICPVCKNTKNVYISNLVRGFFYCDYCHSVASRRPDLIKYLVNKKDALLTCGRATKVKIKCPDCGLERPIAIKDLVSRGFRCTSCGDYISYPEKFLANILEQLNVQFIRQFSSKDVQWCDNYRYDFYIPLSDMIIETNGRQHYEDGIFGKERLSATKENDEEKRQLALKHNIKHYIVLDCRYSTPDWIKTSILQSKLNGIYDLSLIDWNAAAEFALKGIVKDVCVAWQNGRQAKDIAKSFHIDRSTVYDYLKSGAELGWCDYTPQVRTLPQKRKVAVFKNEKCIGVFDSIASLVRQSQDVCGMKLNKKLISDLCNSETGEHKGLVLRFAEIT